MYRVVFPLCVSVLAGLVVGGPPGRLVRGGLRQARRGSSGTFLGLRWRGRAALSGWVIGLGAGLVSRWGTLGWSRCVAGILGLGSCLCGFRLFLLTEFSSKTGFEGERARWKARGATAGAGVTVAAARAWMPWGWIWTSAARPGRSSGEKMTWTRF